MHIEAATYNNALQQVAQLQKEWEADFLYLENLIEQKKQSGEPYASLEINLRKGRNRYAVLMQFFAAADAYIQAMEADTEEKKQTIVNLTVKSAGTNTANRVPIADMPVNNQEYFIEILQRLEDIHQDILQPPAPRKRPITN